MVDPVGGCGNWRAPSRPGGHPVLDGHIDGGPGLPGVLMRRVATRAIVGST